MATGDINNIHKGRAPRGSEETPKDSVDQKAERSEYPKAAAGGGRSMRWTTGF